MFCRHAFMTSPRLPFFILWKIWTNCFRPDDALSFLSPSNFAIKIDFAELRNRPIPFSNASSSAPVRMLYTPHQDPVMHSDVRTVEPCYRRVLGSCGGSKATQPCRSQGTPTAQWSHCCSHNDVLTLQGCANSAQSESPITVNIFEGLMTPFLVPVTISTQSLESHKTPSIASCEPCIQCNQTCPIWKNSVLSRVPFPSRSKASKAAANLALLDAPTLT